ncbi:unnamed protein product, partial [Meganyctiphanes norvegica]
VTMKLLTCTVVLLALATTITTATKKKEEELLPPPPNYKFTTYGEQCVFPFKICGPVKTCKIIKKVKKPTKGHATGDCKTQYLCSEINGCWREDAYQPFRCPTSLNHDGTPAHWGICAEPDINFLAPGFDSTSNFK